ncbi:hypothetical protein [Halocola ammonii]
MKLRTIIIIGILAAGLLFVLTSPNINKKLYSHVSQKDHCEIDCAFGNAEANCPGNQAHCECLFFAVKSYCDDLEVTDTLSFDTSQIKILVELAEFSRNELGETELSTMFELLSQKDASIQTKKRALDQCRELVSLLSNSEKNALNNFVLKESGKKLF